MILSTISDGFARVVDTIPGPVLTLLLLLLAAFLAHLALKRSAASKRKTIKAVV